MKFSLINRLSQSDIHELCALTQGERNNSLKEQLYQLTLDSDRRVATNALWVFTHFSAVDNEWLFAKHDQLIDRCLKEKDATKLRLMLNLLLRQPFDEEAIRTDFIDFCLTRLADPKSPYAVRAQCIKLAYEQMRYWPELLNELRQMLEMISCEPLSPGLRSAWRQVMKKL
ncbi:MAG: hypothetical protein MSA05_02275 [Prevotella sp.]|uniref:hypothetical protein n=1 Tax=uncultured Prevotella sp. TaxID=159272 RepID=UPI0025F7E775|nr:hypothetical protein [Prevotella sp.]MCI7182987.1 hypothetical protein [Prevotella sp.]